MKKELLKQALNGSIEALKELAKTNPEFVFERGEEGLLPSHIFARDGYAKSLSFLKCITGGIESLSAQDPFGQTPASHAAEEMNVQEFKVLIKIGADCVTHDFSGWSPAHWAASSGSKEILELIAMNGGIALKTCFLPNDQRGTTPAHLAAREGHLDCLLFLKDKGAYLGAKTTDHPTVAELAVLHGHRNITEHPRLAFLFKKLSK
jgi:ankyrin repeat protein